MKPLLIAVLSFGFIVCGSPLAAQPAGLVFERIGSDAGLSHNSVYALTQDRQGFLWIGTVDGLNRYDGYEFIVYRHAPADSTSLSNSLIRALLEDRHGDFWVGTDDGLNRFDRRRQRFYRYPLGSGRQAPVVVHALYEDRAGTLWAGAADGLYRYDRARDRFVAFAHALRPQAVHRLQEDLSGALWMLVAGGGGDEPFLYRYAAAGDSLQRFAFAGAGDPPLTFLIDGSGRFWFDAVAPVRLDTVGRRLVRAGAPPSPAWALHASEGGVVWAGGEGGLLRHDPSTQAPERYRTDPSASAWLQNFVRSLYEDRSGVLWVGTHGGLYRYDPHAKSFVHRRYDRADPNSLTADFVSAVYEDPSGVLWVGTFGGGLNRVEPGTGRVTAYRHVPGSPDGLPSDIVWAIHPGRRGVIWLGVQGGLCSYDPRTGRITRHRLRMAGREVVLGQVGFIADDGQGQLWLATTQGLYAYDPERGTVRAFVRAGDGSGPGSNGITALLFDPPGTLWVGTDEQVLDRLDLATGVFAHYPLVAPGGSRLRSEGIWTIHRDTSGALWLGTGTGLSRFDPSTETFRHYLKQDGLPGSVVYSILEDRQHRLWLGTNLGLAVFDPRLPPGRQFRTFDAADGTGNTEFNRHAAFASSRGTFFFGGMDGLTGFDPALIRDNPIVPPVVLVRIQTANREGTALVTPYALDHLRLSYRDYSLWFEFAALSFTHPRKNRYAYRLEGFDAGWIDAGTSRVARYTNLPAGDYVFRVRGSNNDGVWNEAGVALPLTILPPFWETGWFRVLVVGLVAGLLAAGYRYRVRRLLEVERLRLRIASDLHDDFSSDLTGIALVTDVVQRRAGVSGREREQLVEVRDTALRMVEALRDVVWYMNPEHDTFASMVVRMRQVAAALLAGVDYTFEAEPGAAQVRLGMVVRQNAFLIYKEALHNVARHARARHVTIRCEQRDGLLRLSIVDDGAGFDPAATPGGHGLPSMRARAARLGADLKIESRPGMGTRLLLTVQNRENR